MIVEPVAGNMGVVPPGEGYLAALRGACDRTGALLVLDEVITGFRVARGRRAGALRRAGRHHLPGQDHRRRPAGGGVRRPRRADAASSRPRAPATRPARCRGTRSPPPRGWPCWASSPGPACTTRLEESGAALEEALRDSGAPVSVNRVGSMLTPFFARGAGDRPRGRHGQRHRGLRALRPRAPRRRRLPAAVPVRGVVHGAHARRRRSSPPPARRSPAPWRRCEGGARARAAPGRRADRAGGRATAGAARLPAARPPPGRRPRPDPGGLPAAPRRARATWRRPSPAARCWPATTATPTGWCGSPTSGDLFVIEALADLIALGRRPGRGRRPRGAGAALARDDEAIASRDGGDGGDMAARYLRRQAGPSDRGRPRAPGGHRRGPPPDPRARRGAAVKDLREWIARLEREAGARRAWRRRGRSPPRDHGDRRPRVEVRRSRAAVRRTSPGASCRC